MLSRGFGLNTFGACERAASCDAPSRTTNSHIELCRRGLRTLVCHVCRGLVMLPSSMFTIPQTCVKQGREYRIMVLSLKGVPFWQRIVHSMKSDHNNVKPHLGKAHSQLSTLVATHSKACSALLAETAQRVPKHIQFIGCVNQCAQGGPNPRP